MSPQHNIGPLPVRTSSRDSPQLGQVQADTTSPPAPSEPSSEARPLKAAPRGELCDRHQLSLPPPADLCPGKLIGEALM